MDFNGMQPGMGFVSGISIITLLIGFIKEILMIYLLFKGIQVANVYLKNNRSL